MMVKSEAATHNSRRLPGLLLWAVFNHGQEQFTGNQIINSRCVLVVNWATI